MNKAVRILIVDDNPKDADRARQEIGKAVADCVFQIVSTSECDADTLERFEPHVVLLGFALPPEAGMDILRRARKLAASTPIVVWSPSLGEEEVIECMKAGASNYVRKEDCQRLGSVIVRALEEKAQVDTQRQFEHRYHTIFENSMEGIFQSSPQGQYLDLNPAMARLYGYSSREEMIASIRDIASQIYVDPQDRFTFMSLLNSQNFVEKFEARNYRKDGTVIWTSISARVVRDLKGDVLFYEGFVQDITQRKSIEAALQNNEQRFRALMENGLDDISLLAADGTLLWESPSAIRNLGYRPNANLGRNMFEIIHPEDLEWARAAYRELLRKPGERQRARFRLRRSDGSWCWVEAIATNMLQEPSVNAMVLNYRDITEQKLAEIELQQKNADLALVNALNEAMNRGEDLDSVISLLRQELKLHFSSDYTSLFLLSRDGRSIRIQKSSLSAVTRKKIEKIIGRTIPEINMPVQEDGFFQRVLRSEHGVILRGAEQIHAWLGEFVETVSLPAAARFAIRRLIPQIRQLLGMQSVILIPLISDGKILGMLSTSAPRSFTEQDLQRIETICGHLTTALRRKQVEEALRESQGRYQNLVETSHDLIWAIDGEGKITFLNRAAREIYGYEPEELIGHSFSEIMDPGDSKFLKIEDIDEGIGEANEFKGLENRVRHRDGRQIILSANAKILRDERGRIREIVGSSHDITARKQAEEMFREERNLLRTLIDNIPDRIYAMDRQGRKTLSNIADWKAAGGETMEDVLGKTDFDTYPPELAEKFWVLDRTVLDSGEPVINHEEPGLDGNGNSVLVLTTKIPLRDDQGNVIGLVGIGRDITARKEAEERLRQSESQYRLATRATNDVIWELNPLTDELLWSENAHQVLGYELEEIGPDLQWWIDRLHPDDRSDILTTFIDAIGGDGSFWTVEYRFLVKSGRYAHMSDRGYIERNENGKATRMIGAMSDITARKEAEIERQALLEIMQGFANTQDLPELLKLIHRSIASVIYAENFSVILYQPASGLFEEIYCVDQYDPPISPSRLEDSITSHVFGSGQPLLLTQAGFDELAARGEIKLIGTQSASWLGVPLKTSGRTIGVMAVQDYENSSRYTEHDRDFLASIAAQVALAIERKQAEEAVREREEQYRTIFEGVQDAIFVESLDGKILMVNSRACEMFGYSQEEFLTKTAADLVPSGIPVLMTNATPSSLSSEPRETINLRASGEAFPIEISGRIQKINGESVLLVVVRDITERKKAEADLLESVAQFRTLFEASPDAILLVDPHGDWPIIDCNTAACVMNGYTREELIGQPLQILNVRQTVIEKRGEYLESIRQAGVLHFEESHRRKDGSIFTVDISTSLIRLGNRDIILGIDRDVTGRKEAEEQLKRSTSLLHATLESTADGILVVGSDGKVSNFNRKFLELWQIPENLASEMDGRSLMGSVLHQLRDPDVFMSKVEALYRSPEAISFDEIEFKDGRVFEQYSQPQRLGSALVGRVWSFRDVTQRKQAEAAEREQRVLAQALRDTAETLSSTLDYGEVLDHILTTVGQVVPHDAATILLIDGEHARAVRSRGYHHHGFHPELNGVKFSLTETANLRQILDTRQPVVVYDTDSYAGWVRMAATDWLHSSVGAPISIYGEVIGFICLDSQKVEFFTPMHAERLQAFANQAALAIHNSRLLQQAQAEIAERRQAEEELRASEERFRQLADNIQEGFWMTDVETGQEIYLSPAVESIWGHPVERLLREPDLLIDSIVPDDRPTMLDALERQKQGQRVEIEYRILHPDGSLHWIWDRAFPITDGSGKVIRVAGISADITERKESAERLRESEDRYHSLFQHQLYGSALHEIIRNDQGEPLDYVFLKVNPAFEKMTGLKEDEVVGRRLTEVLPGIENETLIQSYGQVAVSGEPVHLSEYIAPLERYFEISAFPAGPDRFAVSFLDVTERRESAMALEKSQSRYRELFDSSPVSIWEEDYSLVRQRLNALGEEGVVDLRSHLTRHPALVQELASLVRVTDVNQASLDLYRTPTREDLARALIEDSRSTLITHFVEEILGLLGPARRFTWEGPDRTFDGRDLEVLVTGSIPEGYEEDWSRVIVSITDITERRKTEQQLRKLSRAVEQSGSSIVITDTLGNIEYVNPKFTRTTGYALEDVMGQNPRILKTGYTSREEYGELWETITSGLEWHGEMLNRKKDGTLFWESSTISPILNDRGEITHFVGVTEDVTERKQTEIETRRHIAELEAVYENGLSVGRLLEPGEIGSRLIQTFSRYLPWHHVTIRLRKEGSDELELVAFSLPDLAEEEEAEVAQHFVARINKVGQGLSGWVIETGRPLRTGNVHAHPQYVGTHEGIQSGLYMPLQVGERVIGVISVESEALDAFTEQDERLLATLANQTAIAFENARLYEAMQTELTERRRVEEALRASETHYRALADSITDILFEMDQNLRYTHWNKASEALTGIPADQAIGKSMEDVLGENEEQIRIKSMYEDILRSHQPRTFETVLLFQGEKRSFEVNAYPSLRGVLVVAKDVTDRKRTETIMRKRLELMEYSAKHSLNELMQKTVDEVSDLTGSAIGFLHFMAEDQNNLGTQTWSTNALRLFEVSAADGPHRSLDQAGVWADAVRQRRPLIENDYESLANKKGFPEGHVAIVRQMVIPIIRNERIMAVLGIANKVQDYTTHDLEIAAHLADYAWDITERKQMEIALELERNQLVQRVEERTADLSRANSNLARALRVKDEFLANMSHELRTPLNAILGLSESLSEQIAGPLNEKQQKYISTISESGHHLLALINDILDLAKIDAGQITLDINKVDIQSVCHASLRMIKQLAQKKNQDISLEIDSGLGLMWADERRLKQMIVNLLGNAVKFTPEYGKLGLEVHGDSEANQIAITVWDNGIGIKEDDLARLFQPFVQLDSGLAREATGTGLGLALVAQMARLHGGGVNAISEMGKGSRFTIVLPWQPVLAMDTASRMRISGKFRAIKIDEANKPAILLVEDTKEVVMMLKDYLELAGYRVFTAQDGVEGIVQARRVKPDLILMDVQMPRMDGFETTRKLRSDPSFRYTPIIALTALAMPHDRERCLAAGMDEYISKPVNLKALIKVIQSCLFDQESRAR